MPFQINLCRGYKHRKNGFKPLFLSLRCGCPVDTSAKQKHRPSRQARPPQGARQSVPHARVIASAVRCVAIRSLLKGNTDSFALRVQNDIPFSCCKYIRRAAIRFYDFWVSVLPGSPGGIPPCGFPPFCEPPLSGGA